MAVPPPPRTTWRGHASAKRWVAEFAGMATLLLAAPGALGTQAATNAGSTTAPEDGTVPPWTSVIHNSKIVLPGEEAPPTMSPQAPWEPQTPPAIPGSSDQQSGSGTAWGALDVFHAALDAFPAVTMPTAAPPKRASCPDGLYRTSLMVFECGGGNITTHLIMPAGRLVVAQALPAGIRDLQITLVSNARARLFLWNEAEKAYVVRDRSSAVGSVQSSSIAGEYKGLKVAFGKQLGHDTVKLTGTVPGGITLRVYNYNTNQDYNAAALNFAHKGFQVCPPNSPVGCENYPESKAQEMVSKWSRGLRTQYSSATQAWNTLAARHEEGGWGVPWHKWAQVWTSHSGDFSAAVWQLTFRFLDTDDDEFVSQKEFTAGFELTSSICPTGLFRTSAFLFHCSGGRGTAEFRIASQQMLKASTIPRGVVNLELSLESDVDMDMYLWDDVDDAYIVHWKKGAINQLQRSSSYKGMEVEFSGDARSKPMSETIHLSGTLPVPATLRLFNYAKDPTTATLQYEHEGVQPCAGAPIPAGCESYDAAEASYAVAKWSRATCRSAGGNEDTAWDSVYTPTGKISTTSSSSGVSWHVWVASKLFVERKLQLVFKFLDENDDGEISKSEFLKGFRLSGSDCGGDGIQTDSEQRAERPVPACPAGTYRAWPLVFSCEGDEHSIAHWIVRNKTCKEASCQVQDIPSELTDLQLNISGQEEVRVRIWEESSGLMLVHVADGLVNKTQNWGLYRGLHIHAPSGGAAPFVVSGGRTRGKLELLGHPLTPLAMAFEAPAGNTIRATLRYRHGKLNPCPTVPAGCKPYDPAVAEGAVRNFSILLHQQFKNADEAWAAHGGRSLSVEGLAWHEWPTLVNFAPNWMQQFRFLDKDNNGVVGKSEFFTAYHITETWYSSSAQPGVPVHPVTSGGPLQSTLAPIPVSPTTAEPTGVAPKGELRRHFLEVLLAVHGSDEMPGKTLGDLASRRLADQKTMERLRDAPHWMKELIKVHVRNNIVKACDSEVVNESGVDVNLANGYYNMKGLVSYVSPVGGSKAVRNSCCSSERLGMLIVDLTGLSGIHSIFGGQLGLDHVSCRRREDSDQSLVVDPREGEAVSAFLGIMAVFIAVIHMAIMRDTHVRFYTWVLVSGAMSIFAAALAVSGIGALVDVMAGGYDWARAFLAYIILFVMLALMQLVVYYVPKNRAAMQDLDERAWMKADVQKASYGEEVQTKEVRSKCDMRSIAFVEGQEHFVRKVRPERERRLLRIRSFVYFLAHASAFSAIQAGAALEHLLFFIQFPVIAVIPVMVNQVILFGFLWAMQYVRSTWKQEGRDKMLDEEIHEAESELASVTLSFLVVEACRYLISGVLTSIDGLEEVEEPHHPFIVLVLFLAGVGLFGVGLYLAHGIGRFAPFTRMRRMWRAGQNTLLLGGAWCFLWSLRWHMRRIGWAVLGGQAIIATLLSLASLGALCALGYVESGKCFLCHTLRPFMLGEVAQSSLVALSALVGFSWAIPFHTAIVRMSGDAHAGLGCFFLGLGVTVLLLPAWYLYAVPRALRYRQLREDMLEATKTGDSDKLSLLVDEGFWDEGFGRGQPGGQSASVWRFYRRQNDKWAETLLDAALPGTGATIPLQIIIQRAENLRAADYGGTSDPYVKCEVPGKSGWQLRTSVVRQQLNPVWNHADSCPEYTNGDPLLFTVFDQDRGKKDDCLGRAVLTPSQFLPDGFEGAMPIVDDERGNKGRQDAKLHIKIIPGTAKMGTVKRSKSLPGHLPRPESSWYGNPHGKQIKPLG